MEIPPKSTIRLRSIKDADGAAASCWAMTEPPTLLIDPPDRQTTRPRPRIVIVEDDLALLNALQFSLEAEGYDVVAFSAQPALLEGRTTLVDADCLLVDYRLQPMDGLQLFSHLRGLGLRAPTILMTSHPDGSCRREARRLGVKIVEKPLLSNALSRLIGQLVQAEPLN